MRRHRVKIKSWRKLVKEFELITDEWSGNRYIDCDFRFTVEMEVDLPKDRVIVIEEIEGLDWYEWESDDNIYSISEDMIEAYLD